MAPIRKNLRDDTSTMQTQENELMHMSNCMHSHIERLHTRLQLYHCTCEKMITILIHILILILIVILILILILVLILILTQVHRYRY